jgi:hypothetical protein
VRRASDPVFLESIANDPRIASRVGSDGSFRAGDSWDRTVALEWDTGGIVFLQEAPGLYSGHWVFLPGTPGVVAKGRQALDYLFSNTDAQHVIGLTPLDNPRAIRAAIGAGMRGVCNRDGHAFCELTRAQWILDKERP